MKLKILILSGALFCFFHAGAQNNYEDVVYLKNGSIIHGMIIEQIPNVSIKIKSGQNVFVYKMDEIEKFTKEELEKSSSAGDSGSGMGSDFGFGAKKGYAGHYEMGLSDYPKGENLPMFAVMLVNGYRFSPYFSAGLGVGAELSGKSIYNFPVYADVRAYFTKTRISPFMNIGVGYNAMVVKGENYSYWGYSYGTSTDAQHGFMFNPAMGVRFAINKKIAVTTTFGYKLIGSRVEEYDGHSISTSHAITLRWGIEL